jgi:predicted HTH domain antitoxin
MSMPDPESHQWADNLQAIDRRVIEDTVIDRYRVGRLSHRQVAQALGLDYWQTETLLKERGAALNYSVTDLEADAATLETILEAR